MDFGSPTGAPLVPPGYQYDVVLAPSRDAKRVQTAGIGQCASALPCMTNASPGVCPLMSSDAVMSTKSVNWSRGSGDLWSALTAS